MRSRASSSFSFKGRPTVSLTRKRSRESGSTRPGDVGAEGAEALGAIGAGDNVADERVGNGDLAEDLQGTRDVAGDRSDRDTSVAFNAAGVDTGAVIAVGVTIAVAVAVIVAVAVGVAIAVGREGDIGAGIVTMAVAVTGGETSDVAGSP